MKKKKNTGKVIYKVAKFTKTEMKKSLLENISLMESDDGSSVWAEYHEIPIFIKMGYYLFNDEKRTLYISLQK